jgi:hypothetical protein
MPLAFFFEDFRYLRQCFGLLQLPNPRQSFKGGLVIEPVPALSPFCFCNQTHGRVVVNGLPRKGGITDQVTDAKESRRYLKRRLMSSSLHG